MALSIKGSPLINQNNKQNMKPRSMVTILSLTVALELLQPSCVTSARRLSPPYAQLDANATAALHSLYANTPAAKTLGNKARAILIFPDVLKGGFMIGAQLGNGVLRQNGHTAGYYNLVSASYGWQVGIQSLATPCS